MTTEQISKKTFGQLQQMFGEVAKQGPEVLQSYLRDLAFSLGAQATAASEPEEMPQVINDLITEFGRGIQTVIHEITGKESKFDVAVYAVNSSQH